MAAPVPPKPDALVPVPSKLPARLQGLADRLAQIAEDDARIAEGVNRFRDLPTRWEPEEQLKIVEILKTGPLALIRDLGFSSREELRLALYGSLPKSEVPFAIQAAHERVGMRIRKDGSPKGGATFNLNMVTIPAPRKATDEDRIVILPPKEST